MLMLGAEPMAALMLMIGRQSALLAQQAPVFSTGGDAT